MKKCPKCSAVGRVIETRYSMKKGCERRRVKCSVCQFRWSVYGVDTIEIDQLLTKGGLPTYMEVINALEELLRSDDRTKALRLLNQFNERK